MAIEAGGHRAGPVGPLARRVRQLVLTTQDGPLRPVWRLAYAVLARAFVGYLRGGERGAAGYVTGSLGSGDAVYGNSDVDAIVVLPGDAGEDRLARVHGRWEQLVERVPPARLILDEPQVYSEAMLRRAGGSLLTHGLDGPPDGAGATGAGGPLARLLVRPGLDGPGARWRRLAGPELRPAARPAQRQDRRIAAWLELQRWWREAFPVCAWPDHPLAADICVKLLAEPARTWLWLEHGERPADREAVLARAAELLPEQAPALSGAAALRRRLASPPPAPIAETMEALLALSERIAAAIERETAGVAYTEVRLDGAADPPALPKGGLGSHPDSDARDVAAVGPAPRLLLPLCDWRELAAPDVPDAALAPLRADPADPGAVGAAARLAVRGAYPALRRGALVVMPSVLWSRGALRAISCPLTDPVTFAVLAGDELARFPELRGWAARDWARQACAEHPARLERDTGEHAGVRLGRALTAARAALFLEGVEAQRPRLALTVAATLRALAEHDVNAGHDLLDEVAESHARFAHDWTEPPERVVTALRAAVARLPAYARERPPLPR